MPWHIPHSHCGWRLFKSLVHFMSVRACSWFSLKCRAVDFCVAAPQAGHSGLRDIKRPLSENNRNDSQKIKGSPWCNLSSPYVSAKYVRWDSQISPVQMSIKMDSIPLATPFFPKEWNSLEKYEQFSISKNYCLNDLVELNKTNSITISNDVVYHKIAGFLNWKENHYT